MRLLIGRLPGLLDEEDLAAECLFDETFRALAGLQSPWARRRRVGLADLAGEPWVLPPYDSVPGALIAGIFRAGGLEPPRAAVVTLSANLTAGVMPPLIERFLGRYPKVRLHVVHAETALAQFQPLRKRRVDLLIGRLPAHFDEEDLEAECLFDEAFRALAGSSACCRGPSCTSTRSGSR